MASKKPTKQPSVMNDDVLRLQLLELRLAETLESLKNLTVQNNQLQKDFRVLSEKYAITKQCAMDTAWRYCPRHSREFNCLPFQDKFLIENENRIGDYTVLDKLGEGQFSIVKRCRKHVRRETVISVVVGSEINAPKPVAVKQISKDKIRCIEEVLRIERELAALKLLNRHPNIVEFIEAMHGKDCVYIVTELLPLDLYDFVEVNHSKLDSNIVAVITKEICNALAHLADCNVAHLDIKPENVSVL